jgi:ribosome-associated toxin RatA of RatAB toxin-antitoxin module
MLNRILTMLLLGYVLSAWGAAPDLHVERVEGADGGKVYRIASSGTVAAAPDVVWRILTDYNHLADYVPDVKSARVLSRRGNKVIVEQEGAASFLFFSRDIRLVVQAHEQAPNRIDVTLVDGDMKVYRCSWELIPLDASGGTRIRYEATIEPKFYVPGIVGASIVRSDVARMMKAVLLRLDRDEPFDVRP